MINNCLIYKDNKTILLALLCIVLGSVLSLIYPLMLKILVDEILIKKRNDLLLIVLIVSFFSILVSQIFYALKDTLSIYIKLEHSKILKKMLLKVIFNKNYLDFYDIAIENYISYFQIDIDNITTFSSSSILTFIELFFKTAFITLFLLILNKSLTLYLIIFFPIFAFVVKYLLQIIKKDISKLRETETLEVEYLQSDFRLFKTIMLNNMKERKIVKYFDYLCSLNNQRYKVNIKSILLSTILGVIVSFSSIFVFFIGSLYVNKGELTIGELIVFYTLVGQLIPIISALPDFAVKYKTAENSQKSIESLDSYIFTESKELELVYKSIQFINVSYKIGDRELFKDVNCEFNKSDIVAIIGENGTGKTTLLNMLTRLIIPTTGKIVIDGFNYLSQNIDKLRDNIAFLSQDCQLFNDTILYNITLEKKYSDEWIQNCIIKTGLKNILDEKKLGLCSRISNFGSNFSGGEKKVLSITRLLLCDPEIIILDEMTNELDKIKQDYLFDLILASFNSKIIFFVTHNNHQITKANKILVLEDSNVNIIEKNCYVESQSSRGD